MMRHVRLLAAALLLMLAASALPATRAQANTRHYLPQVSQPSLFEVVITDANYSCDDTHYDPDCLYPSYYYVRGYVRNTTDLPLYDIKLMVEETWVWGNEETKKLTTFSPVFPATLPGQRNPFDYTIVAGKMGTPSLGALSSAGGALAAPDDLTYAPLTSVWWARNTRGETIGVVRNDSGRALTGLRLALIYRDNALNGACRLETASLGGTLAPGASASFNAGYSACRQGASVVVGQGAVAP